MLCEQYQQLSPVEQIVMIGKIVHALQSDNKIFLNAKELIELADSYGLFENVTILPNTKTEIICGQQPFSLLQPE